MSDIDKQRIAAVRVLESIGFAWSRGAWLAPAVGQISLTAEADAMHGLLMGVADELMGCPEGSAEAAELEVVTEAIQAYEAKRWPTGKIPGGKG